MKKKILIAAGGTGGHVVPALGLAEELSYLEKNLDITLAGHVSPKVFVKSDHPILPITAGSIKQPLKIIQGMVQGRKLIREVKPDLMVGFGSFHCFPILYAGKWMKVPLVLHEGNAHPGKVNKLLSSYSLFTAVQFKEAAPLLKGETKEALLPLKMAHQLPKISPETAILKLGLQPGRFTLLIFGGSLGATSINQIIRESFRQTIEHFGPMQVIHLTGNEKRELESSIKFYKELGIPHHVSPFTQDMTTLWQAADFAICRAGASTIRELIHFEIPSLLIPYPHATDGHQLKNASFISQRVGGGLMVAQHELSQDKLFYLLNCLFSNKMATLRAMKQALRSYKRKATKKSFAELIQEVL